MPTLPQSREGSIKRGGTSTGGFQSASQRTILARPPLPRCFAPSGRCLPLLMSNSPDVAVTGISAVTAIGIGAAAFWDALCAGRSAVRPLDRREDDAPLAPDHWRTLTQPGVWLGAPMLGFDGAQYVRPRKAMKVMARELQTAFAASYLALQQALGEDMPWPPDLPGDRVATVFGSQMYYGPNSELVDAFAQAHDAQGRFQPSEFGASATRNITPLWMLKYLPNMPACHVGIALGATGANNTIVAGDVSSTSAIMESVGVLHRGIADWVICGAGGSQLSAARMLYRGDWEYPHVAVPLEHSSRPHCLDATGVIGGEAAAALILQPYQTDADRGPIAGAHARRSRPLAMVGGWASRFHPVASGQRGSADAISAAIEGALHQAGMSPDDIGAVVSHGIGDQQRDSAECYALQRSLPDVPLVMPTALLGHTGAAVGMVYAVTAVLMLQHDTIPPSALHGPAWPGWASRFVTRPQRLHGNAVLVLTHTSQGVANALILLAPAR